MDIDIQLPIIIKKSVQLRKRYILSYRRHRRLTYQEKKCFEDYKDKYHPEVWRLALHIKSVLKIPFSRKLFRVAKRILPKFKDGVLEYIKAYRYPHVNITEAQLIKEFSFQGFKPMSNINIKEGFAYIGSKTHLEGQVWIYPIKYAVNYAKLSKGKYLYIYNELGNVGIPGYTKIYKHEQ